RLRWVADRDGPEQLLAIDLLETLDASAEAQATLTRMADSPDPVLRRTAHDRLIARAIRDGEMGQLNALLTVEDDLAGDPESLRALSDSLSASFASDDPLAAIHALDLFQRLDANGVGFDAELRSRAAARLDALSNPQGKMRTESFASTLSRTQKPVDMSGPAVNGYLGSVSDDLSEFRKVLDRG
ncbi:MAG: hypothetical protein WBF53_01960, partial [Litorimonas sp.]